MDLKELKSLFKQIYGRKPEITARAPGRVNLLGEHVDYNGGPVLPAAIDRAVTLAAAPTQDNVVSLNAADLGESTNFSLDALASKTGLDGNPLPSWVLYPAGVTWALKEAGLSLPGIQVVYSSDVPIGSGLSSSAAVEVAFATAWRLLTGWQADMLRLAQVCQRAENIYVGVNSGLMDQFASACGVKNHALYFDTHTLEYYPVPLPPHTALVVADSGVRRTLAGSAYNDRRAACEEALHLLKQYLPSIQTLADVSTTEFAAYSEYLPPEIEKRAEHVIKEVARVHSAVNALRLGETRNFGALMYAGHNSLRDLYEVSVPELDILVKLARKLGAIGARLTGAGFGGCTINLVDDSQAQTFIEGLKKGYLEQTGKEAQVYLCKASDGAKAVKL